MNEPTLQHGKKYKLNLICLRRFRLCLSIICKSYLSNSSLLLTVLLGLCLAQQLVINQVGLLPSQFYGALGTKDHSLFSSLLLKSGLLIVAIALFNSVVKLATNYLYLFWRSSLTNAVHRQYFTSSSFYFINVMRNDIDNVDQRMTQDIDKFCLQLSDIIAKLIISPLTIIYYSYQCFHASGYIGPLTIYGYFIVGCIMNKLIMSPIVHLIYKQEQCEGNFRFKHTQIRSFAESIALLKAGGNEYGKTSRFFNQLLGAQKKIAHSEFLLNFSTSFIDYIGSFLSYFVIAIPIFAGSYDGLKPTDLSVLISKNSFNSMYLINNFSSLIDLSSKIMDICGYTHRIGELLENLEKNESSACSVFENVRMLDIGKDVLFRLRDITYHAPNTTDALLSNLNLTIEQHKNVLITGNTGKGKSSLVRVLAGLWQPTLGQIELSTYAAKMMFFPQNPVLTNGSLIDQVIYPKVKSVYSNDDKENVRQALESVGLQNLISRIGDLHVEPEWSWSSSLSPGEIQRLSFARLFYHRPVLAVLDEATSALGIIEEECFYVHCRQLEITLVSVGHRDSLKQYHDFCLNIVGNGEWEYYSL